MPKYNVRRKAQLGLDIREGGIAIPIAPNMYYMKGRSHDNGGIAIGPNNKNGLEVEGGEVVKVGNKDIKVFSSVPLLRGVSPAQLVMGGANPNKVFKAQEDFKDIHRINDDGTRYEIGGQKIININDMPSVFRGQKINGHYVQLGIPPATNKASKLDVNFKQRLSALNDDMKDFIMDGIKYGQQILPKSLRKYYAKGINILNSPGVHDISNAAQRITQVEAIVDKKKTGGIYIKPSKRGTFTAAATKHGMGVQEFASKVLANKEDYSPAMVKKANFARNASRWKKELGGEDDTKTAALKRLRNKFTIRGNYDGGLFGGAGAGSIIMKQPEFINDTITKKYLIPVTQNFNDAFSNAVDAGLDKFMFNNKWYSTEKGNNPNNNAAGAARTQTIYLPVEHKEVRRRKKKFGGSMIYSINGNVRNGLMSVRPKAQYGLATKYLKKKDKSAKKSIEIKQNDEPKVLDIRNTAGYKIKQFAENPWVKYPVEVASYLLTGATAKGMQIGTKVTKKAINKIDDILGKPRQEYLSRNVSDKTISYTANSKSSVGNTYKATSKDLNRAKKEVQNRPTINDLAEAKSTVGNVPQHTTISYNPSPQNPVSTINYFDVKNTKLPNIERFGRKQMDDKTSRELDKVYRKAVGNKEPKSGFGRVPQQTTIKYTPKGESISAYDASVEFHKRISDMLYNNLVKKYGKKGVDKAMKAEHISKYEYGGRIKAKNGKFLKYKNGVFTDPETGEQFDVDPEVFKMYGNTKESGVIPTADYTKGTFNARPQFYAEKRIGLYGDKSLAEKFGLARSGWSFGENPKFNYVPNVNISIPNDYKTTSSGKSKSIAGSTPRKGRTQSSTNSLVATSPTITSKLKSGNSTYDVSQLGSPEYKTAKAKLNTPSTGGQTQTKDGRWVGQYKSTNVGDWIGLGTNVLGSIGSYLLTKSAINKMPDPIKPVMAQAAKLKTKYNIEPQLTNVREAEQMNRATVRRNTASSNTSIAREQRLVNESRGTRNQLYGQKENIETQLINQDRLNRQSVRMNNARTYNDYLNKLTATRQTQNQLGINNINNLIYGLTGSVNNILGNIESRKATNNTIRAIAASNPNVDARLIGGFDYYIDPITKKKYNKNQQYVGTING